MQLIGLVTIITTFINIVAAVLIAARVIYLRRRIQAVTSERNSQYTTVVVICVESAVLIILFSIMYIVLDVIGSVVSFIFMESLVYINVRDHNLLLGCSKNRQSYCLKN